MNIKPDFFVKICGLDQAVELPEASDKQTAVTTKHQINLYMYVRL